MYYLLGIMTGSTALPNEVHVSISLPYYTVQPMCRIFPGGNAYEQTIWMIYGKWCICKFHWNCIFGVWIQKQSWNVFFLKEKHTELHAMWGDRQTDGCKTNLKNTVHPGHMTWHKKIITWIITADHFMHLGNPNICKRGNTYS